MKSLESFPKGMKQGFSLDSYNHDLRKDVAVESPYTGDVGLELELEGHGLPETYRAGGIQGVTWVPHADNSLRAVGGRGAGGMEYVLNQPCSVDSVEPLVSSLFNYIAEQEGRVLNSTRCSTHVHLNMRGMKLNQLCSFVALWGTFEDVLSNWCGAHRSGNHFALRLKDSNYAVDQWEKAFRTGSFQFQREYRYLALNPVSLNTFGSLEVRTMRGVDSAEEVVTWVEALLRLRDLARSKDYEDPTMIALNMSGMGVRPFFDNVFGNTKIFESLERETVLLGEDVDSLVRDGFRRIQPIIYTLPWQSILSEINKPYIPNPFGPSTTKKKMMRGIGVRDVAPDIRWVEQAFEQRLVAPRPMPAPAAEIPIDLPPVEAPLRTGDRVIYRPVRGGDPRWVNDIGIIEEITARHAIVRFEQNGIQSVNKVNVRRI